MVWSNEVTKIKTEEQRMNEVVRLLLKYGEKLRKRGKRKSQFTPNEKANSFLLKNPLAFLFGVIVDQGIKAEKAWSFPYFLSQRLGHLDVFKIAKIKKKTLGEILSKPPALHRFNNNMAENIIKACRKVINEYEGDALNLWKGQESTSLLYERFKEFHGIGQKKASMAVNILINSFGIQVKDLQNIDVSYDIHVRRVFLRTGLSDEDSQKTIISQARKLNPNFPGALDFPAWSIGRSWCHPSNPKCDKCILNKPCLKIIYIKT